MTQFWRISVVEVGSLFTKKKKEKSSTMVQLQQMLIESELYKHFILQTVEEFYPLDVASFFIFSFFVYFFSGR